MITQAYLKSILRYNPLTGEWTWRVHVKHSKMYVGDRAGSFDGRYNGIMIRYKKYSASRLAVFYMTGKLPDRKIAGSGS
jgi:hypothetical protein